MSREKESPSSISTFLKCPYSYKLSYIDKVSSVTTAKVENGKWVHKQLEEWAKAKKNSIKFEPHKGSSKFIEAVEKFLIDNNDEIVEVEKHFVIEISGQKVQIFIDALTKNCLSIDYKITGSPGFYKNYHSYQNRLYSYILRELGFDYKFLYLLLETNTTGNFKELHEDWSVITDLEMLETEKYFKQIMSLIKNCYDNGVFPPSYNSCASCFYKKSCPHYWGF